MQECVQPVHKPERTTQIRHKELSEILIPQPRASAVFRRLLDWIDRVDQASQVHGMPRPPFLTADGTPIFPDKDEWWLLDMKRKRPEAQEQIWDEDGPVLEEDAEGHALVTDSSAGSENDEPSPSKTGLAGHVAWDPAKKQ
eukprot:51193-Karenia_brevis.AAC.1